MVSGTLQKNHLRISNYLTCQLNWFFAIPYWDETFNPISNYLTCNIIYVKSLQPSISCKWSQYYSPSYDVTWKFYHAFNIENVYAIYVVTEFFFFSHIQQPWGQKYMKTSLFCLVTICYNVKHDNWFHTNKILRITIGKESYGNLTNNLN